MSVSKAIPTREKGDMVDVITKTVKGVMGDNVLVTSSAEQAFTMQGVTDAVMASLPVVHWQFVSVRPQDVEAIAVAKQETC